MNETHKTSNLRKISRAGRAAMREAGSRNLQEWKDRAEADVRAQIDAYASALRAEIGENASCTKRALVEAVVATYACLLLVQSELRKSRSKSRAKTIEKASWLAGNLSRLLKQLDLDRRPKPRTLAEVFGAKVAPSSPINPAKGPISA